MSMEDFGSLSDSHLSETSPLLVGAEDEEDHDHGADPSYESLDYDS